MQRPGDRHGTELGPLPPSASAASRAALALGFDDLVALVRHVLAEPNELEAAVLRAVLTEIMPGQEERIMSIAAEQWKAEARNEGRTEGRTEGRIEGLREGQARALLRLFELRFGQVPDAVRERVAAADRDALDHWLARGLDAATLDAVFEDGISH